MAPVVSIQDVVIQHFDAFQQELLSSENNVDAAQVQARATLICRELKKLLPTNINNKNTEDSLDDSDEEEEDTDVHQVTATLLQCVDHCMAADVSKDSIDMIHGMLHLVACMAAHYNPETNIPALVGRAIQYSSSIMERVRSLACKLVGYIVEYSSQQDDEHQESVEAARKTLIARLTDKSQAVRNVAIGASSSFFSFSSNTHTILLESVLWNMAHDPSAANRMAALESIPVNADTLDNIIARVRDEKVKVRIQAIQILSKKANGLLQSHQYAQIVRSSLGNRCTATKDAARCMICASWMKHVRFDPVALVGLLDPVVNESECRNVCRILFDVAQDESPLELEPLSPAEIRAFQQGVSSASSILMSNNTTKDLTFLEPRAVLVCNAKCNFLSSSSILSQAQRELAISKLVPDVVVLCEWLELHLVRLIESIQQDEEEDALQEEDVFVCSQLLQLAQATDLKEEGSRRHFIAAMTKLLVAIETPDDLLEGSIQALKFAHSEESAFLQTISDIISELSTLYTPDNDDTEESENDSDDGVLQNVSTLRIISILAITLENTSASMASDSTLQGFSFYIVPAITSRHALIREGGVSCLGRLAMLSDSETVLEEFKPLLLNVASNQDETLEIRAQAIMAICDLSFLFKEMLDKNSHEDGGGSFVPLLVELLGTSKPAVVAVAAEVASKLLFAGRTSNINLLANLVVTYFDPDIANLEENEDEHDVVEIGSPARMQQLLSLFFPAYGMRGVKCKSALVSCIEPMLHVVAERLEQKGVKVSDWSMARMVEYVESFLESASENDKKESSDTATNKDQEEEGGSQDQDASPPCPQEPSYGALVAIQVSQFLIKKQESVKTSLVRQLCKALGSTHIDVHTTESSTLSKLKTNMDELGMCITDSTCLRSLKPLVELLDSLDAQDDDDESTETEDNSDGESSLAEALEAIAVAERASIESTEKENEAAVAVENEHGKGSSKTTRGRRRLASMN